MVVLGVAVFAARAADFFATFFDLDMLSLPSNGWCPPVEDRTTFLPTAESTRKLDICSCYNISVEAPPTDRPAVEAAVVALQERLADGDPADAVLQSHCEAVLLALRAAYRVTPAAFSRETIEALRELSELLRQEKPSKKIL